MPLERLDLGGGLGIRYRDEEPPAIADYAAMVTRITGNLGVQLSFEPGRAIVGNAGVLLARSSISSRASVIASSSWTRQ